MERIYERVGQRGHGTRPDLCGPPAEKTRGLLFRFGTLEVQKYREAWLLHRHWEWKLQRRK